jgi:N-acetylglucosamine kinase-like BadF-type ATPase
MSYVLGVDGGNTKTIALVARLDGVVVGAGRGGCGDIYGTVVTEGSIPEVECAVYEALAHADARPADILAGVFSMAGADWPEDFRFIEHAVRRQGFGRAITIVNDALGALRAGSPDGVGVSVVCGTGAAIGARAADGRFWHGSFWLESLGAHALGRKALRAVFRAALGIDAPTALSASVLAFYGQPHAEALLHLFTAHGGTPPSNVHHLARAVLDAATAGDRTARQIVEEHGASIGDYALAAARQVGIAEAPFTLVLAGGVLRHPSPLLSQALVARVRAESPQVRPVVSRFEPAVGALFLALEAAGVTIDEPLLARLAPTLPPAEFFAT